MENLFFYFTRNSSGTRCIYFLQLFSHVAGALCFIEESFEASKLEGASSNLGAADRMF